MGRNHPVSHGLATWLADNFGDAPQDQNYKSWARDRLTESIKAGAFTRKTAQSLDMPMPEAFAVDHMIKNNAPHVPDHVYDGELNPAVTRWLDKQLGPPPRDAEGDLVVLRRWYTARIRKAIVEGLFTLKTIDELGLPDPDRLIQAWNMIRDNSQESGQEPQDKDVQANTVQRT